MKRWLPLACVLLNVALSVVYSTRGELLLGFLWLVAAGLQTAIVVLDA